MLTEQQRKRRQELLLLLMAAFLLALRKQLLAFFIGVYGSKSTSDGIVTYARSSDAVVDEAKKTFLIAVYALLWQYHRQAALLGSDGNRSIEFNVGEPATVRQQAYMERFADQVADGRYPLEDTYVNVDPVLPGAVTVRAALYANALTGTTNEAWGYAQGADTLIKRVLGPDEDHCPGCLGEARKGFRPVHEVTKWPGDGQTECLVNCYCHMEDESGNWSYHLPEASVRAQFAEISTSAEKLPDGSYRRSGLFFPIGSSIKPMEGPEFGITHEDVPNILAGFKPFRMGILHDDQTTNFISDNMFADNMPVVESLSVQGDELHAVYRVPSWFQEGTNGKVIPHSSVWDRATKLPIGDDFVPNPAVKGAALMGDVTAAFARFKTFTEEERKADASSGAAMPDGSYPIKDAKDVADAVRDYYRTGQRADVRDHIIKRAKAIGAQNELPAELKGSANMGKNPMRDMHHMAVDQGAECGGKSMFADAAKMMKPEELKALQDIHDMCKGDKCEHCNAYATGKSWVGHMPMYSESGDAGKGKRMSLPDMIKTLVASFRGAGMSEDEAHREAGKLAANGLIPAEESSASTVNFSETAEFRSLKQDNEALRVLLTQATDAINGLKTAQMSMETKSQLEAHYAELRQLDADGKITPAQRKKLEADARENPASFGTALSVIRELPPLPQFKSSITLEPATGEGAPAGDQLIIKARAIASQSGGTVSYAQALQQVARENEGLARAHFSDRPVHKSDQEGRN